MISISFPQIYETATDEMKEMKDKILLCIEKQALVQIIIRKLAEQLVESNYVSVNQSHVCVAKNLRGCANNHCFRLTEIVTFARNFECTY